MKAVKLLVLLMITLSLTSFENVKEIDCGYPPKEKIFQMALDIDAEIPYLRDKVYPYFKQNEIYLVEDESVDRSYCLYKFGKKVNVVPGDDPLYEEAAHYIAFGNFEYNYMRASLRVYYSTPCNVKDNICTTVFIDVNFRKEKNEWILNSYFVKEELQYRDPSHKSWRDNK